jgi:hypothetical protein
LAPVISTGAAAFSSSRADRGNDDDDDNDDDADDNDGPSLTLLPGAFSVKANGQHPDAENGKTGGTGGDDDDLADTGPSSSPQASHVDNDECENHQCWRGSSRS